MKQYDVSIVVPVYNCEDYIEECVKSINNQDYPALDRIQVILINDGSTDNSLEICCKIKEKYKELCIEIITGENEGVSATRNKGIMASKGKYIMFVDADDIISRDAIKKLVSFFNENYDEIDIVSYPRYEYNMKTKKEKILQRYKDYFTETGIYDLNLQYENIEPTLNVMVKNFFNDNILFDTNVFFHEDTLYVTQIAMLKQKIGYINNAKYLYRIYGNSTTDIKENPMYSFDQYMYVFKKLFDKYKDSSGKTPKYIQRLFLNVIRYRIIKDKLFPYHLEGKEWENAYYRIVSAIRNIENDTIMEYTQLDKYHKLYLIDLKNEGDISLSKSYDGKIYTISDKKRILFSEDKADIVINRFNLRKDKLYILGYLKSVLFRYKKPELFIVYEDKKKNKSINPVDVDANTLANRYKTNIETAKFYKFEFEINVYDIDNFSLQLEIDGKEFDIRYIFNTFAPFNSGLKNYKTYFGDYRIQFKPKNKLFYVRKPDKVTQKRDFKRTIVNYYNIDKRANLYRIIALKLRKHKKNKIWLYYDRVGVFDNGYAQFKHDVQIKDNIKKYYVLDGNIEDYYEKFSFNERKYVVKFGSFKHKILFLNSDKILTSFSSLQEFTPFYKKYSYYRDILKYRLVYLQHGILHANLLKMYGKEFIPIDKFIISSNFEKENLINNYGYSKKDLICTGMPRLDEENENIEPENKIIFAPSWRKYLIGEAINRRRIIDEEKFKRSKYYKEMISFLTDKELIKTLEKNNIVLDYKLHPIFEPYKQCFKGVANNNITVSIGGTDLSKCKAFITDFSSFQFDFVKFKRPIIYFMPDLPEFKAGLHSYRELDLKYEDAFGHLCLTGNELVKEIVKVINNNFEAEPIYRERMEKFFFNVKHRKDRLYDILKED